MIKRFQEIFVESETQEELKYEGDFADGKWTDGKLSMGKGTSYPVTDGIPDFIRDKNDEFGRSIRNGRYVYKNWESRINNFSNDINDKKTANIITDIGGDILEVAVGPNGGNIPYILLTRPGSSILINDISKMILEDWKDVLININNYKNVSFSAFDARKMPVRSESFDVVSSFGGISNIIDDNEAVKEIYRVLKPGGYLVACELEVPKEDMMKMPRGSMDQWKHQGFAYGYKKMFEENGFDVSDETIVSQRNMDSEQDDLQKEADKYDVQLRMTIVRFIARKRI